MTIRVITPAGGAAQLMINWDGGASVLTAGQILDVVPGSPHESAIGLANLTTVSNTVLADDQQGSGGPATGNG